MSELLEFVHELVCPDLDDEKEIVDAICKTLQIKAKNISELEKKLLAYFKSRNYLKKGDDVYSIKVPTRAGILTVTEHRNYAMLTFKGESHRRQLESSYSFELNGKTVTRRNLSGEVQELVDFFLDYVAATGGADNNPYMDQLFVKAVHPLFPKDELPEAIKVVSAVSKNKGIPVADICDRWIKYLQRHQYEERRYVASLSSFAKSARVEQEDGDYPPIDLQNLNTDSVIDFLAIGMKEGDEKNPLLK